MVDIGSTVRAVDVVSRQGASGVASASLRAASLEGPSGAGGEFAGLLDQAVRAVDAAQDVAASGIRGMANGTDLDIHGSMIALEEANISLRAMVSVRDKVVDAYHTIWGMAI